jgi:hypothetical protein
MRQASSPNSQMEPISTNSPETRLARLSLTTRSELDATNCTNLDNQQTADVAV